MKSARRFALRGVAVDPPSRRDQRLPVSRATARKPNASRPASAMQYATTAKGTSRIPRSVRTSPTTSRASTGSAMISPSTPNQNAREKLSSIASTTPSMFGSANIKTPRPMIASTANHPSTSLTDCQVVSGGPAWARMASVAGALSVSRSPSMRPPSSNTRPPIETASPEITPPL